MNVQLCVNYSENNVVNKQINIVDTVTAIAKGIISVENPILLLQYKGNIQDVINYAIIEDYNRNYFITDIIDLTGGKYEIHLQVDVLESFKTEILALNCIINKQQILQNGNRYFNDGSFASLVKEYSKVINFSNGFNDNPVNILICAGGD